MTIPQEVLDRETFVQEVGDIIHEANASTTHREGFCLACGEVYVAMQLLLGKLFCSKGLAAETQAILDAEEAAAEAERETFYDPRCGCPDYYYKCPVHGPPSPGWGEKK